MALFSNPTKPRDPKIAEMSFEDLLELKHDVDEEVQSRQAQEVETLRQKLTNTAAALGVPIAKLFKKERKKVKYQNPDDPNEHWSGRGKLPLWLKKKIKEGHDKDDFLVESEPAE